MDTHTNALLIANQLTLSYGDTVAVDALSLQLHRGEVLGLLGLNGAGKSSTLRMLAGITAPGRGDILIDGVSLQERPLAAKRMVGFLPEIAPLYVDMRVRDYLVYAGRLRRVPAAELRNRIDSLLPQLRLENHAGRRIANLSKGYRQRVGLAQALVHDPALLILDEPSSGLDPEQMREMRELIRSLRPDKGILFSSHLLSEVTELCDRVSVLHEGKLVHEGPLDSSQGATGRFIVRFAHPVEYQSLQALPGVEDADTAGDDCWALSPTDGNSMSLLPQMIEAGLQVLEFAPERPSLETLFSSLVNNTSAVPPHPQPARMESA